MRWEQSSVEFFWWEDVTQRWISLHFLWPFRSDNGNDDQDEIVCLVIDFMSSWHVTRGGTRCRPLIDWQNHEVRNHLYAHDVWRHLKWRRKCSRSKKKLQKGRNHRTLKTTNCVLLRWTQKHLCLEGKNGKTKYSAFYVALYTLQSKYSLLSHLPSLNNGTITGKKAANPYFVCFSFITIIQLWILFATWQSTCIY